MLISSACNIWVDITTNRRNQEFEEGQISHHNAAWRLAIHKGDDLTQFEIKDCGHELEQREGKREVEDLDEDKDRETNLSAFKRIRLVTILRDPTDVEHEKLRELSDDSERQSVIPSLLPALRDFAVVDDDNDSLAPEAPESISSSQGYRWNDQYNGLLVPDNSGALTPNHLPPLRDTLRDPPVLECPFNSFRCTRYYAMENIKEWFDHSLTHFRVGGRHPRILLPPISNQCCFCDKKFYNTDGLQCWMDRMKHVAWHHHAGHKLAHARPDFKLFRYLWENGIIDNTEYRELGTLAPRPPQSALIPTPPDSPLDSPPDSPPVVVAEYRRKRFRE